MLAVASDRLQNLDEEIPDIAEEHALQPRIPMRRIHQRPDGQPRGSTRYLDQHALARGLAAQQCLETDKPFRANGRCLCAAFAHRRHETDHAIMRKIRGVQQRTGIDQHRAWLQRHDLQMRRELRKLPVWDCCKEPVSPMSVQFRLTTTATAPSPRICALANGSPPSDTSTARMLIHRRGREPEGYHLIHMIARDSN